MRVLLFTGKGGVGKTTAAAATAVHLAAAGVKVLVLSTDPAHSLADALGCAGRALGPDPVELDGGLCALQADTRRAVTHSWQAVQRWLVAALDGVGLDPLEAEELTELPGAEEVLALLALREQAVTGRWDVLVVDCAPTAQTLRLLALPEALAGYLRRAFPLERRLLARVRPVLGGRSGLPTPGEGALDGVGRLVDALTGVRTLLTESGSVRLVLTPESVVVAESRRALTMLSLHGYRVDGVVANRVFPTEGADGWRAGWVQAQQAQLAEVEASFAPLPVLLGPYAATEPVGPGALAAWATSAYGDRDPLEPGPSAEPLTVERTADGWALLLALPLAAPDEVDLVRRGDDLLVTVGAVRRVVSLPSALRRCTVEGARLREGRLRIAFVPDPALWMTS